jgi:peroxiredoxin
MKLGDAAPDFKLQGVDGKTYTLADFKDAKALVVIFSCNHCPYVQAYEDRMIAIQNDYAPRGARIVLINSNDSTAYPEDSFEKMAARAEEIGYTFPYLRDESQQTARDYGATHTPHLFVFDASRRAAYTGKIDDDWKSPAAVKQRFLRDALDDLLAGRSPRVAQTHAIGCTIKWR